MPGAIPLAITLALGALYIAVIFLGRAIESWLARQAR